jgi:hypothetical protein
MLGDKGDRVTTVSTPPNRHIDHLNGKVDLAVFLAELRPAETILMTANGNRTPIVLLCLICVMFFGGGTYTFYDDYYVFDSAQAACASSAQLDCARFYGVSKFLVPLGAFVTIFCLMAVVATLIGFTPSYVLTDQRIILRSGVFPRKVHFVDLKGAQIKRDWIGISVQNGFQQARLSLVSPAVDQAYNYLTDLARLRTP